MNILIVDDNSNNRMILRLLLEDYSDEHNVEFVIDEAADGIQAVEKCNSHDFDIVLMDIMMPNMDGIEATKVIREFHPGIMIIAVSAVDDSVRQKQILSNGAEDYISKPVNSDIFTSRVSNYVTIVNGRSHERENEYNINLFTKKIYNRNTKFMIHTEDNLSEFWEFFLLTNDNKYDDLSDVIRTLFSIADTQVRLDIYSDIYIEESDAKQYFTLTCVDSLPSRVLDLILKKNAPPCEYKIKNDKISFELNKIYTVNEDPLCEEKTVTIGFGVEEELVMPIDTPSYESKELTVFDYIDEDDLVDLQEYAGKLNSLMLIAGSEDITEEEIGDIYLYLDRLASVLSTYTEIYPISKALSELSHDMSTYTKEFIEHAEALGPMCKAFSNDLSSWIQMSFYTGAPSIDFMNDTIVVNCHTISSMLKMNDESTTEVEEFDDIFDF